jgi:hypothetical protein
MGKTNFPAPVMNVLTCCCTLGARMSPVQTCEIHNFYPVASVAALLDTRRGHPAFIAGKGRKGHFGSGSWSCGVTAGLVKDIIHGRGEMKSCISGQDCKIALRRQGGGGGNEL